MSVGELGAQTQKEMAFARKLCPTGLHCVIARKMSDRLETGESPRWHHGQEGISTKPHFFPRSFSLESKALSSEGRAANLLSMGPDKNPLFWDRDRSKPPYPWERNRKPPDARDGKLAPN